MIIVILSLTKQCRSTLHCRQIYATDVLNTVPEMK